VPYTLMKFLAWGVAFFAVGMLTGWLLRSLRARSEVAAARSGRTPDEASAATAADDDDTDDDPDDTDDTDDQLVGDEPEMASAPVPPPDPMPGADDPSPPEPEPVAGPEPEPEPALEPSPGAEPEPEPEPELDLEAASAILGCTVKSNDLTLVDGIGPKIAELCTGIGVITWQALAHTEVVALQSMLDAAGSRYKMHDPSTWPTQAAFLAAGDWEGFRRFHDERTASS